MSCYANRRRRYRRTRRNRRIIPKLCAKFGYPVSYWVEFVARCLRVEQGSPFAMLTDSEQTYAAYYRSIR